MRIGLLTYHHSTSYGAMMQTYATCRALKQLGHDVVIIDIRQPDKQPQGIKKIAVKLLYGKRDKKIETFKSNYYAPLSRRYYTMDELRSDPPQVDCLLVGSDQTWNPNISKDVAMAYFLDFGGDNIMRCSYASSFGVINWDRPKEMTETVCNALHKLHHLSVREKTGVRICKETFGLDARLVIDPTLLFDSYYEITGDIPQYNELLCYKLLRTDDFYRNIGVIKKKIGIPARLLINAYPVYGLRYTYPPSIEEWLDRIGGSKFVLTDSFHGVAFCLIYNKQFAVIKNHNGLDSRFVDLMAEVGLEKRVFDNVEQMSKTDSWLEPIDYTVVNSKLNELRDSSWEYLSQLVK